MIWALAAVTIYEAARAISSSTDVRTACALHSLRVWLNLPLEFQGSCRLPAMIPGTKKDVSLSNIIVEKEKARKIVIVVGGIARVAGSLSRLWTGWKALHQCR